MINEPTVRDIAHTSFVLMRSVWPVARARGLAEGVVPTHVIVRLEANATDAYYLFTRHAFLERLTDAPAAVPIESVLDLQACQAVPPVSADSPASTPEERFVVMLDKHVVGFVDRSLKPSPRQVRGQRDSSTSSRAAAEPGPGAHALIASLPQILPLQTAVSLLVRLTADGAGKGAALPLTGLVPGSVVHVVVVPGPGVEVDGEGEGSLAVPAAGDSLPMRFAIRATRLGAAAIEVLVFHGVQPLGSLRLAATVVDQAAGGGERATRRQLAPARAHQPDLTLLVLERAGDGDQRLLELLVTASDPALKLSYQRFGPIALKVDPQTYFEGFFDGIERLPQASETDRQVAHRKLEAKGARLFQSLIPPALQASLWQLRDRGLTMQIHSEEPWIPWELCKLCGEADGRIAEGPFFGEAFAVTRWIRGIPEKPALRLKQLAVVVPEDPRLDFAAKEGRYVKTLATEDRKVQFISATYLDVAKSFALGIYDGWHFSGHGNFGVADPSRSAIYLRDRETFTPEDIGGVVGNLGLADPMIFLNACRVGRSGFTLSDIGGWAAQFLRAGSAVFIGAYWSVSDESALEFAVRLYDGLLTHGLPIGEAAREARLAVKAAYPGDPTWLAYTVFANPLARVETG